MERMPEITFTGDLSHFVVIGEFYGWEDERAIDRMDPILQRIAHLHGRISNGEQVQVDVGDGSGDTAQFFVRLWARAMSHWRKGPGRATSSPSPANSARPATPSPCPTAREFSDRWEQSLVMKRLAEQAWAHVGSRLMTGMPAEATRAGQSTPSDGARKSRTSIA